MKLQGNYFKDGNFWLSEIPLIDFMDQGKTKKECLTLVKSAIEALVNVPGFKVEVEDCNDGTFLLSSSDNKVLLSFVLRRLRESKGMSIRDVADKLGLKSHTEYARHEKGEVALTMDKFNKYVNAISEKDIVIRIA